MTDTHTSQAPPLETIAFDELAGSFRGELLLPTSPGYDRVREAYGDQIYRRLAEVKAKYDPDNAFHHNRSVRPG